MATGDDATAAGMDTLTGNEQANTIATEISKSRDYIAQFFDAVKAWATGLFLPKSEAAEAGLVAAGKLVRYSPATRIQTSYPSAAADAANKLYVDNQINGISIPPGGVPSTGGTFTGNVFFPNASAATSGYAVAYLNGDGRLSRNASSERYKEHISEIDPSALGDIWPALTRYQMRQGDGSWKYGYIAERLNEVDEQRPFVVYQTTTEYDVATDTTTTQLKLDDAGNPVPDSIDFIALLMAQNAQLHQAVELLAQRLDTLEEGQTDAVS